MPPGPRSYATPRGITTRRYILSDPLYFFTVLVELPGVENAHADQLVKGLDQVGPKLPGSPFKTAPGFEIDEADAALSFFMADGIALNPFGQVYADHAPLFHVHVAKSLEAERPQGLLGDREKVFLGVLVVLKWAKKRGTALLFGGIVEKSTCGYPFKAVLKPPEARAALFLAHQTQELGPVNLDRHVRGEALGQHEGGQVGVLVAHVQLLAEVPEGNALGRGKPGLVMDFAPAALDGSKERGPG